jgi:hypothetical protein
MGTTMLLLLGANYGEGATQLLPSWRGTFSFGSERPFSRYVPGGDSARAKTDALCEAASRTRSSRWSTPKTVERSTQRHDFAGPQSLETIGGNLCCFAGPREIVARRLDTFVGQSKGSPMMPNGTCGPAQRQ